MKWICIKEFITFIDDKLETLAVGQVLTTENNYDYFKKEWEFAKYFMPLAEYRDKRIDDILND